MFWLNPCPNRDNFLAANARLQRENGSLLRFEVRERVVLRHIGGQFGDQLRGPCPIHEGARESFSSHDGEYLVTANEARALSAWLKVRGPLPGPLFPSNRKTGIDRRMLDVLMKRYGAAADLPADQRHFHVLKHSCGTHLLSGRGLDVAEVQDHLGHADIRNTMIYARITNRRRDEVARRLESW